MDNHRLSHVLKWQEDNALYLGMMKAHDTRKEAVRRNKRNKIRRATDPAFKIQGLLRGRLRSALKGKGKSKRTMELVGCTAAQLKVYIEQQFAPLMSWDNHGEWEIDHRCPVALFDLSDPIQQRICFHYTNLQPLWKRLNRQKSDSYTLAMAQ
jgi:hypothetical protein